METFSALLALCEGDSAVTCEFPPQRPVKQSFDVFFDLRLNKQLSKQSWGWWFETPPCSLWRHCNWNENLNVIFSSQEVHLKMPSTKCWQYHSCLNALISTVKRMIPFTKSCTGTLVRSLLIISILLWVASYLVPRIMSLRYKMFRMIGSYSIRTFREARVVTSTSSTDLLAG